MSETFTMQCFSLKITAFLGVWFTNERKIKIPGKSKSKSTRAKTGLRSASEADEHSEMDNFQTASASNFVGTL